MNKAQLLERMRKLAYKRIVLFRFIRMRRLLNRVTIIEFVEGRV